MNVAEEISIAFHTLNLACRDAVISTNAFIAALGETNIFLLLHRQSHRRHPGRYRFRAHRRREECGHD